MASDEPQPVKWSLAVTPLPKSTELGDEVDVVMLSGEKKRVRVVGKTVLNRMFYAQFLGSEDKRIWEIPIAHE